jgi:hypothetical protein
MGDKDKKDKYELPLTEPLCLKQGIIVSGLTELIPLNYDSFLQAENSDASPKTVKFKKVIHEYSIIVSQSCDLVSDYHARREENPSEQKIVDQVIVCNLFDASRIRADQSRAMNSAQWKFVEQNRHKRYYFFEQIRPDLDLLCSGMPEMVADFKKLFAVDTEFFYSQLTNNIAQFRSVLISPYLESFVSEYYNFQSRVALPEPHDSI